MDPLKYNVVYVDRRVLDDKTIRKNDAVTLAVRPSAGASRPSQHSLSSAADEHADVSDLVDNLRALLHVFPSVSICSSGPSCVSQLAEIAKRSPGPTLLLLDIPWQADPDEELQNGVEGRHDSGYADLLYGTSLLRYITLEMDRNRIPRTVIPVAVISDAPKQTPSTGDEMTWTVDHEESQRVVRCVDLGAADVLISPFNMERTKTLSLQCYKVEKDCVKRGWPWPAQEGETPPATPGPGASPADFIYLREKMVSELMHDIIKPRKAISNAASQLRIAPGRMDVVRRAVGKWHFSAHDFTNDELLECAVVILEHALKMPEVEQYRIDRNRLVDFLVASKAAYNDAIPYHNFRHVVDVLQACFAILLEMGVLPPYPWNGRPVSERRTALATLIRPVDALTLLISAVGHDAGHPGVNNAFLVNLKAPLAQLYNDRSVLESFHCAAFSQVIRKYWPKVQTNEFRKTMIDIILATDMGLHFDYMGHLEALKRRVHDESVEAAWDEKTVAKHRILLLSLIIKCADISNVARGHECAAQWAIILIDEFSRQASMESQLGIPSALAMKPQPGSMLALAKSQCGFMKLFAIPLFESLAEIVPELSISVDQLQSNIEKWLWKVKDCETVDQPANLKLLRTSLARFPDSSPFVRSADTDGEARQSPDSLTNSRRSSGRWSDDEARTREETPRSSTGSPHPAPIPVTRSHEQLDRLSTHSGLRPMPRRQITEPVIVVEDTAPPSSLHPHSAHDAPSRLTKTLSSFRSRGTTNPTPPTHTSTTTPPPDLPNNKSHFSTTTSTPIPPYAPTPAILTPPPEMHLQRPKSSPANGGMVDVGGEGEKTVRKRPSRFFKVRIWGRGMFGAG